MLLLTDYRRNAVLMFVDRQYAGSPYCPRKMRVPLLPKAADVVVAPAVNVSCDDTCRRKGGICDRAALLGVNSCDVIMKNFKCTGGCAHQVGPDLPAFEPSTGKCYITNDVIVADCGGLHI